MTELTPPREILPTGEGKPAVPGGLNVLTILTFIGCAIGFIGGIWNFIYAKKGLDKMEETINSGNYESLPAFAKKFYSPEALEMTRKGYENRVPMTIISILGIILCLYGAIQMRKLRVQGYYLYLIGEIIPLIATLIFIGTGALTAFSGIIAICITLLFIILYTAQRKHLTQS